RLCIPTDASASRETLTMSPTWTVAGAWISSWSGGFRDTDGRTPSRAVSVESRAIDFANVDPAIEAGWADSGERPLSIPVLAGAPAGLAEFGGVRDASSRGSALCQSHTDIAIAAIVTGMARDRSIQYRELCRCITRRTPGQRSVHG